MTKEELHKEQGCTSDCRKEGCPEEETQEPKHEMYCNNSNMRCAVYHTDGICPDVRDCKACKQQL